MSLPKNKRKTSQLVLILLLFLLASGCATQKKEEKRKMNLLFILTDQQRFDTMKAYGNEKIKTPNLNRLAGESIVFKRTYVTQPVCTPSRSSVMTGLYPHTSGCTENNIPLPAEIKILPQLVGDPSYYTAYMGKWHLGDEVFIQRGFNEWQATEDYYLKHYSSERDINYRSAYHHWLVDKGLEPDGKDNRFSRGFAADLPLEEGKPKFLEEKAIAFLESNRDNPFILYINFLEPHSPFSSVLNEYHNPEDLIIPDVHMEFDSLTHRNKIRKLTKSGIAPGDVPDFVRRYWGLVSKVDMSVGNIMKKLEELELNEHTLVVFTSDHGEMLGSHSFKTKRFAYDESSRVPLLIRLPGQRSQRIIEEPVSQIDLIPTILDYMGYSTDAPLQGKSLVDVLEGGELKDNYVFFEMAPLLGIVKPETIDEDILEEIELSKERTAQVLQARYRAIVSPAGWKMVVSDKDKNQLFNLQDDPHETLNMYYDGQHAEVIERLSAKLQRWQSETGDTLNLIY